MSNPQSHTQSHTQSDAHQLELDLEATFEAAAVAPQTVSLVQVLQQFEQALADLPHAEQLRLGAILISQLAQIYEAKADWLLEAWEDAYNPQPPIFSEDWLRGLVRQEQQVDVSMFTAPVTRRSRSNPLDLADEDSVAETVDKAKVLAMVDQITAEEKAHEALMTAHEENISGWIAAIMDWMNQQSVAEISLVDLHRSLDMPLVQLWLALLLGNFSLEQRGEFYSTETVWAKGEATPQTTR